MDLKPEVAKLVAQFGDYAEQEYFKEITEKENIYLNSNNISKVEELLEELESLKYQMHWKEPDFIKGMFAWLVKDEPNFKDESRANLLIGKGLKFLEKDNMEELSDITRELIGLLSREDKEEVENKIGFY